MSDVDQPPPMPVPAPDLVARARLFRDAGGAVSPAKPSATVMVVRDNAGALEVFMLRRRTAMLFAAGMHVFPGGGVDPADSRRRDIGDPIVAAAIRETFEETGIVLAAGEWLRPWSRWITPEFEPRRYDTHFFVAVMPAGQQAHDMGGESDAAVWTTPAAALDAAARGEWLLMPPTEVTLRELLPFRDSAEVFEAAAHRVVRPWQASVDLDVDPPAFVFRTPA
jgi:8-oxo-dGTP pyrophosphatase MutT (NUDIX family)